MSRGTGRIERAIEAAFLAAPDSIFMVEDLCRAAYPGINRAEKKHRVAVLRAAYKVAGRCGWQARACSRPTWPLVFFNPFSLRSYALSRMRSDSLYQDCDTERLNELLDGAEDGWNRGVRERERIAPGGAWWRHVEINIANRVGDASERAQALRTEQDGIDRKIDAMLRQPLRL